MKFNSLRKELKRLIRRCEKDDLYYSPIVTCYLVTPGSVAFQYKASIVAAMDTPYREVGSVDIYSSRKFDSLGTCLSALTIDVAEAQTLFQNFAFFRSIGLHTNEDVETYFTKKQAITDLEGWLRTALFKMKRPRMFSVVEKYQNGTWERLNERTSDEYNSQGEYL